MATRYHPNGFGSIEEALQTAVDAVERGNLQDGEAALSWILKRDPKNTAAWLWLACCAPDDQAKQECYRQASVSAQVS